MDFLKKHGHNQIKICVSGAAETGHCGIDALDKAKELGREIARQGAVLVTGATTGFPLWAAMGAKEAGGISVGLSPAASEREHVEVYKLPLDYLDLVIYTGFGYPGRDLLLTRSSDAVICGSMSSPSLLKTASRSASTKDLGRWTRNSKKFSRRAIGRTTK